MKLLHSGKLLFGDWEIKVKFFFSIKIEVISCFPKEKKRLNKVKKKMPKMKNKPEYKKKKHKWWFIRN